MLKIQFKDKRQNPLWVVEKVFTIGSAADNNLVIADPSVSAHHARLIHESQRFLLQDSGSARGTFVNGQRINQRQVGCGDTIRCGDVEIDIVDPFSGDTSPRKSGGKREAGEPAPATSAQASATRPAIQAHTAQTEYWALIADASWRAGQEFPLTPTNGNSVLIGRSSHCDIVFPGTHLSREHARLTLEGKQVLVTDLNTANGTYINDKRVAGEATAVAGDRIRLDIYSFTLLGPGISLPQSVTVRAPAPKIMKAAPVDQPEQPKQWKTRPTSPGNREVRPLKPAGPTIITLASVVTLVVLIVAAAYLLLT